MFENLLDYTTDVHDEVTEWVADNIERWMAEGEDWFKIEMIDDKFLPKDVFEGVGGVKRKRNSVSLREAIGLDNDNGDSRASVHPEL